MSDEEVIRYGAGGKPYVGKVGPQSTEVEPTPQVEEKEEEPKVSISFEEDDTPVSDDELKTKIKGGK
jgi:hypothetical protein